MIKYFCTNYNVADYFDRIANAVYTYMPNKFPYTSILHQQLKCAFENMQKYKTLNIVNPDPILANKNILYLGAGPSLGKNLAWIKENQDKFIIVAIATTLRKLIENDIKPDLIISADANEIVMDHFPANVVKNTINVPTLVSNLTYEKVLETLEENDKISNNLFLVEFMGSLKMTNKLITGYSVGEAGIHLVTMFGANNIFMLGIDLALDSKTGATHSDGRDNFLDIDAKEHQFMKSQSKIDCDNIIFTKGNFQEKVPTTNLFTLSLQSLAQIIQQTKHIKYYNLSDGAYIQGATPTKIEQLTSLEPIAKPDIKSSFIKDSEVGFNAKETQLIKHSVKFVKNIKKDVVSLQKKKISSYRQLKYEQNLITQKIANKVYQYGRLGIIDMFDSYMLLVMPYLRYIFNDPKNKDDKTMLNKAKNIWVSHMSKICDTYIKIAKDIK